jgi:hypothetical protein
MAYADLLDNEGIKSQYLVVMKPRRVAQNWTLSSGTIYYTDFDYGTVVACVSNGTTLTESSDNTPASNEFYYDRTNMRLLVNVGADPTSAFIVATYEIYLGTFDAHWYRDPLSDTTDVVYYEPLIQRSPSVTSSSSDVLFGFLPVYTGQVVVSNLTQLLQKHMYDSSFSKADCYIYHYLDELTEDNIKLILKGIVTSFTVGDDSISFAINDRVDIFDQEYRNNQGNHFYSTADFPDCDPNYLGRPIRNVYGVVDGFVPVNISYVQNTPTTSDNRNWICIADDTNLGSVSTTVPASPASTTTRTYLTSADGFNVGDTVWLDSASGPGSDSFVNVEAVNKSGAHYIDHDVAAGGAAVTGSVAKRSFVGRVDFVKNGIVYNAKYGRDYTELIMGGGVEAAGFTFVNNMETTIIGPSATPLEVGDTVYARVYGHTNQVTLNAAPFGDESANTGNLAQGIPVLIDIMKNHMGIAESDIDITTFTALQSSVTDEVGFAIPAKATDSYPTYKQLVIDICKTLLLKFYTNGDIKWSASQLGPLGSVDKTIEDDEILNGSIEYAISYYDMVSAVLLQYAFREVNRAGNKSDAYSTHTVTSDETERLHRITRQKHLIAFTF